MDKKISIVEDFKSQLGEALKLLVELEKDGTTQQASSKLKSAQLGETPFRVIHLKQNPVQMEINAKQREFEELETENTRLKARLELLESGDNADVTRRLDNFANNTEQVDLLSRRVAELQAREDKILDSFGKIRREFREVCYLLTGYRVEVLKDRIYSLSNMYAENEEDKLFFQIDRDETVQLLENEYSERLSEFIETYLENADSFPAFLASITLDLFKSTTQLSPSMSMCMSTTIQPNPNYRQQDGQ